MNMVGIETYHFNCLSVANNLLSNPPPPLSMICAVGPSLFTAYAETRYYPSGDQLRQRTLVVPPHCLKGCVISLSSVNCSPYSSRSMWGYVLPYRGLLLTPSPRYDGTLPPRSRFWAFQITVLSTLQEARYWQSGDHERFRTSPSWPATCTQPHCSWSSGSW